MIELVRAATFRKLICILFLLGLLAGGEAFVMMPKALGEVSIADAHMADMECGACGEAIPLPSCEALRAALPAVDALVIDLEAARTGATWVLSSESGPTQFIRPDTSPPRA